MTVHRQPGAYAVRAGIVTRRLLTGRPRLCVDYTNGLTRAPLGSPVLLGAWAGVPAVGADRRRPPRQLILVQWRQRAPVAPHPLPAARAQRLLVQRVALPAAALARAAVRAVLCAGAVLRLARLAAPVAPLDLLIWQSLGSKQDLVRLAC